MVPWRDHDKKMRKILNTLVLGHSRWLFWSSIKWYFLHLDRQLGITMPKLVLSKVKFSSVTKFCQCKGPLSGQCTEIPTVSFHLVQPTAFEKDACCWKGQLERTRSWKVLSWKIWKWKFSLKLERAKPNWKEPSEVGKNRLKLERYAYWMVDN